MKTTSATTKNQKKPLQSLSSQKITKHAYSQHDTDTFFLRNYTFFPKKTFQQFVLIQKIYFIFVT